MTRQETAFIARADEFAAAAHARVGQLRKYTNDPYIVHPRAVARIVRTVPHDVAMIAAAHLHDTVEDTGVMILELEREFGLEVATLVDELTDKSKPGDGNRAARKALDRARLARVSARAQTIKLADLIDNSHSILRYDVDFAMHYIPEKAQLLQVLERGDPRLHVRASKIVADAMQALGITRDDIYPGRPRAVRFRPA
jgi:(p)ppGpp synthase/HD superfamily hydrolase